MTATIAGPVLLDVDDVAAVLCVPCQVVEELAASGELPRVRLAGPTGPVRFRVDDVLRFVDGLPRVNA